jgi:hypothetical protein
MVREYESPAGADVTAGLGRNSAGIDHETRIRRRGTRWVLDAERLSMRSTLVLPATRLGPGSGPARTSMPACARWR